MLKPFILIWFLFFSAAVHAQHTVQTIVPLQPITVGTAFQVQYIVTDNEPALELQSPAFGKDFRFVSGPHLYQGEAVINNTRTPIQNFSYTLIPLRKGRLQVKGATAVFKSGKVKSGDTFVVVTDEVKQDPLTSTPISNLPRLAPGAMWDAKLQEQLFIKTTVSRQSCFVGEPIVATFTLFSRLPSASEIIKNPGLYGFSVLDMPDATEGAQTVQTYNGTFYNTHILRKVQLYPAQAGDLLIDKMSVNNAIEYADSASGAPVRTEVVLDSKPITITVKPLPATTAENFSGAVGNFSINAYLEQKEWSQNSNGNLRVDISGSGNFVQLAAPEIQWPDGIDVFEPKTAERLQKEAVPVSGTRTYTFTFTTADMGEYTIQPIAFTYFNPIEKKYKTATTDRLHFRVLKGKSRILHPLITRKRLAASPDYWAWFAGIFIVAVGVIFIFLKLRRPQKEQRESVRESQPPDFETLIRSISPNDPAAYRQLQQYLMGFLKSYAPHEASPGFVQQVASLPSEQRNEVQPILDECEAVQYYNTAPTRSFGELQQQALHFIQSVKNSSSIAPERGA